MVNKTICRAQIIWIENFFSPDIMIICSKYSYTCDSLTNFLMRSISTWVLNRIFFSSSTSFMMSLNFLLLVAFSVSTSCRNFSFSCLSSSNIAFDTVLVFRCNISFLSSSMSEWSLVIAEIQIEKYTPFSLLSLE